MEEKVTCLLCGHSAVTLARHLKAAHGVTAESYRAKFPDARIRSEACEANRRAAVTKAHASNPRNGQKKVIHCPCGATHEVGLTFASKDHRCPSCKAMADEESWAAKVEGEEYVTCQGCSYRAENLTSHIQNTHPEWVGCYSGQMVAFGSAVRDKTALKGRSLSEETKVKMAASAGWNRGLTKEADERVARSAEGMKGREAWSKGLTKDDHPSLRSASEKLMTWSGPARTWNNGLEADLSGIDFTPFLDESGAVDRKTMAETLSLSEPTITKYMAKVGLRLSDKYIKERSEKATVRLLKCDLERFSLGNGKIVIAQAMVGLGHSFSVIKRECDRHGLPTFHHRVRQTLCLDAISKALKGAHFRQEWESMNFINPKSGRRFRFDGFFPDHNLIVEFHGYQHWTFPSVYIKDERLYAELQERDRLKENLIHADPTLRYFLVRESEPYADPEYLRARLMEEGIFDPGA